MPYLTATQIEKTLEDIPEASVLGRSGKETGAKVCSAQVNLPKHACATLVQHAKVRVPSSHSVTLQMSTFMVIMLAFCNTAMLNGLSGSWASGQDCYHIVSASRQCHVVSARTSCMSSVPGPDINVKTVQTDHQLS